MSSRKYTLKNFSLTKIRSNSAVSFHLDTTWEQIGNVNSYLSTQAVLDSWISYKNESEPEILEKYVIAQSNEICGYSWMVVLHTKQYKCGNG